MLQNDDRVIFNIMCYPIFKNIWNFLEEIHILLVPNER